MRVDALDYHLPPDRIATQPVEPRDAARLMVVRRAGDDADAPPRVEHRTVTDLPDLGVLRRGDLMVVNQTRVLPAAFEGVRVATGGRVGGLYLESISDYEVAGNNASSSQEAAGANPSAPPSSAAWRVLLRARGSLQTGEHIDLTADEHSLRITLVSNEGRDGWIVATTPADPAAAMHALRQIGRPPLPPYILHARRGRGEAEHHPRDAQRYNTVFAAPQEGPGPASVAAPTAGLHFTPSLLARLDALGVRRAAVTLHVGPGTFAPIRSDNLDDHPMHAETYSVPDATLTALRQTRDGGGRILAVGTTSVRTIESLPKPLPEHTYHGSTNLFIRPDQGFAFQYTDMLLTNFHLPRSTLLALVASLPGMSLPRLLRLYHEAMQGGYRFYSYGDAMLIC